MKRFSFENSCVSQWLQIIQGCLQACIIDLKIERDKQTLVGWFVLEKDCNSFHMKSDSRLGFPGDIFY